MEVYTVGGTVRDELLGEPAGDRDWVVVGATVEQMLARGFRRVGQDFPVFIHPDSGEEYALARTERKTAPGYRGFQFHASPQVTLEQDLARRDLTINAIARDADGRIVDPYGGRADLEAGILRHVSPAFAEDPVRILRTARFAARFASRGFTVAPETMTLMRQMVADGEVDALVAERVWQETHRALLTDTPTAFFAVLRECNALARVFPEIEALYGVPQPRRWHPEIDTGVHTMMALQMAARLSESPQVRFAVLVHDLGKAVTPAEVLPSHRGHEQATLPLLTDLCNRLRVPKEYLALARIVAEYHGHCHRALQLRANTLVRLLVRTDALRRPARFEQFLLACEADARGRKGLEDRPYPQAELLRSALRAVRQVDPGTLGLADLDGPAAAARIHQARVGAVRALLDSDKHEHDHGSQQ